MGFRFRKSINLGGGAKLNFNKKSVGLSVGGKGLRFSVNSNRRKTATAGIPGTGLYYTKSSGGGKKKYQSASNNYNAPNNGTSPQGNYYPPAQPNGGNNFNQQPKKSHNAAAIIWLIIFFPVGLYLMWAKTNWNKVVKIIITAFFALMLLIGFINASNQSELPASGSGITSITINDENIRLDKSDSLNDSRIINVEFTDNGSAELLNSDFKCVVEDESIATAEVQSIYNTFSEVNIKIEAVNIGTTTIHIETTDGAIKSNEITIEVIGEETTTQTTTKETTTETTTKETTTETTTKRETTTRETTTEEKTTKDKSRTVYITPTGEKYHYSKSCAGKNAIESTLNEVKDRYDPCKKCTQ